MNNQCLCIKIPNAGCCIHPGDIVKLGRFDEKRWKVGYNWYTWGGNRPVLGWFLTNIETHDIKPLQLPDLDDIYIIES